MALWSNTIFRKIFVNKGDDRGRMIARLAADIVAVLVGIALLAFAIAADRQWLDRHFLPPFFVSRRLYVLVAAVVRVMLAILGVALALVLRPRIGRFIARVPPGRLVADVARISIAVAL